ncbi:MAG: NAD-binding protein [Ectothiorhodospiraceae bacterium]|nr:NAD-binding protein [Ectothiorhodospiraceae bacterium]
MRDVFPLFLRRMRTPLIAVISAYAIAVLGFTLIPGTDDQGNTWRMSFFQAFYVVSYTGSTIGFGEVPYAFSNAQRLWTTVSIYLTVIAWLYSVGTIISLLQDQTFRQAVIRSGLRRSLRQISEPFYLVCGYGDTGRLLVRALTERGRRVVVVDNSQANIDELTLKDLGVYVPAFCMDAGIPDNLITAGLQHRWCMGVLAVTEDDNTNLEIAISSKLLNSKLTVYGRAENAETARNMASFGTDHVIQPDLNFAQRLALALREPDTHRVYDWLSSVPNSPLPERNRPPEGSWIICGYGRLGQAVYAALQGQGIEAVIIDDRTDSRHLPPGAVVGKGTEAKTLEQAGIDQAAALIACRSDDRDNLSIVMTARELRPDIYLVARQNRLHNKALFRAAEPELTVEPSYIIASKILSILGSPLLSDFLKEAEQRHNDWNRELAGRIRELTGGTAPETWTLRVSQARSPAIMLALELGEAITVESLCRDPRDRDCRLDAIPLLIRRGEEDVVLPEAHTEVDSGDRVLFCGTDQALGLMHRTVNNLNTLRYVHTGEARPDGLIWRKLARRRQARTGS